MVADTPLDYTFPLFRDCGVVAVSVAVDFVKLVTNLFDDPHRPPILPCAQAVIQLH